ncbi:23S rRNA (uracil(1939)-C(5))-methyltransferase RlmD [Idiomarina aminovorans]|uniref:23S rRNA (uracil(1939)-C(5))-methyltransferase RlmD n=1 Tax=Idiomarina aminovorans TaxID=2914829 RepID=UPI002004DA63|nr:23S rRNA (uracil(1939)-C(5))-methyltransferase RlmD [Idiomarina sp. ATCH4]MCK7460143.1 23S rRNA (uracil(1939)-C(5))-methyltransferase RlmD [Idiomarina sp. ATCH4]
MAQFFKPQKRNKSISKTLTAEVSALDHQARAVVRSSVKGQPTRFIMGALPGEVIQYKTTGKHSGTLERILEPSADRREAPCKYYVECGGCDFQHVDESYQLRHKQQVVEELFQKFGVFDASTERLPWQEPLVSAPTRYRRRVRLATRWLGKEQKLLIGLREAQSHQIVAIDDCRVADERLLQAVNKLYPALNNSSIASRLGHLEAINTNKLAILLRITDTLPKAAIQTLEQWQAENDIDIGLQSDSELAPLNNASLSFDTSIDGDKLYFQPGDFLQVNGGINDAMVQQAMDWLAPEKTQRVYDFFAGIGNFSVPLARRAKSVLAVEGVHRMAEQARRNAEANGLNNLTSLAADLNDITASDLEEPAELWCLDPARPGAEGVMRLLRKLKHEHRPKRIVYVSCAANTLARDIAAIMGLKTNKKTSDYRITRLCTVDMFPQTHHIETMVCLERES